MRRIRSLTTIVGLSLVILALGAIGVRAQGLDSTRLAGTFTLPVEAQWGTMTLPAGNYSLYYGEIFHGVTVAYVAGKADGTPHGFVLARSADPSSATENSLICIRDGNSLVVRKLEMPVIGESVNFAIPHGVKLLARNQKHSEYALAEAPTLIESVPVTLGAK